MDTKLVGYLLLVLKTRENLPGRSLLGQLCTIHGKGRQTVLKTTSGVVLTPVTDECEQEEHSAVQIGAEAPLEGLSASDGVGEPLASAAGDQGEGPLSPFKRKHPGIKQGSAKKSKLEGAKSPRSAGRGGKKKEKREAASGEFVNTFVSQLCALTPFWNSHLAPRHLSSFLTGAQTHIWHHERISRPCLL